MKTFTLAAFKDDLVISLCKIGQFFLEQKRLSNEIEIGLIQKSNKPNVQDLQIKTYV